MGAPVSRWVGLWMVPLLVGAASAGVLAAAHVWAAPEGARAAAAPRSPTVAVVDMTTVLRGSAEWQDLSDERARLVNTMERTLAKLTRQVQLLRTEQENQPPGTEQSQKLAAQVQQALDELNKSRADFNQKLAQAKLDAASTIFTNLTRAVDAYADEHGVDLVLKKFNPGSSDSVEQNLLIATAAVLHASAAMDISDAVVQKMNADYRGPIQVK
jgi:Skp family chaperone for outer membrane proteins